MWPFRRHADPIISEAEREFVRGFVQRPSFVVDTSVAVADPVLTEHITIPPEVISTPLAATPKPIATLDTIISEVMDVKPREVDIFKLPCEGVFEKSTNPRGTDLFERMFSATGKNPRKIELHSLQKVRLGHRDVPVPVFDLINPFFPFPPNMREYVAIQANKLDMSGSFGPGSYRIPRDGGLLIQIVDDSRARMYSSIGENSEGHKSPSIIKELEDHAERNATWGVPRGRRSESICLTHYCTIPGNIKEEDRRKIWDAKHLADKVGGECRLIIEADWKIASEQILARAVDPLIVIRKGDDLAYIDRFDCTAEEEHLAREHAIQVNL